MDQIKIGQFIAERRKNKNLTQLQLAEKLNITDRAVSKWENGKSLPDASIMIDLCKELEISVNELLSGEVIKMEEKEKKAEENLLELKMQKEEADKRLLAMEIVIGVFGSVFLLTMVLIASFVSMPDWLRYVLIGVGAVVLFAMAFIAVKIEQVAGYYECARCHHKYVPTYAQVNLAMHMGILVKFCLYVRLVIKVFHSFITCAVVSVRNFFESGMFGAFDMSRIRTSHIRVSHIFLRLDRFAAIGADHLIAHL